MWKNVILLGAFAFLLCACGGARNAKLPDGSEGYSINCNGTDNDWADCYHQAADKCYGPYEIVSTNTVGVGNTPMRNIIVKCKK